MSKHTPGPWRVGVASPGPGCRCMIYAGPETVPHSGFAVAEAFSPVMTAEANARLIAAAPELLEALKLVEDWMIHNTVATNRPASVDKAVISAISKAEG